MFSQLNNFLDISIEGRTYKPHISISTGEARLSSNSLVNVLNINSQGRHQSSRGMPILAHNEKNIVFKKQVITLYEIYR